MRHFGLALLLLAAAGCPSKAREAQDWSQQVRQDFAEKVPVVVRAAAETFGATPSYSWCRVRVLHILKNTSGEEIPESIDVRYFSYMLRIPLGESTFYLERVKGATINPWIIRGGSADKGISHNRR